MKTPVCINDLICVFTSLHLLPQHYQSFHLSFFLQLSTSLNKQFTLYSLCCFSAEVYTIRWWWKKYQVLYLSKTTITTLQSYSITSKSFAFNFLPKDVILLLLYNISTLKCRKRLCYILC